MEGEGLDRTGSIGLPGVQETLLNQGRSQGTIFKVPLQGTLDLWYLGNAITVLNAIRRYL